MSSRILVTGANGFVGKSLCLELFRRGYSIRAAVRDQDNSVLNVETVSVGQININTDWREALSGVDVIVHLAARVHVMNDNVTDEGLAEFRKVNVEGTLNLARQAVDAGIKRFIFISSVKVNGEETIPGLPFTAEDEPAPMDAYGISKREAEDALRRLANETGIETVIIRPPLVYGPGVKANFHNMMRYLDKSIPLPLGAIQNQRSLVALDNLIDLIITCTHHPAAINQTFLVSDGEDVSTPVLLKHMAIALGNKARLIPIPCNVIKYCAYLIGKRTIAQRLCGSLQVDISKTHQLLEWTPPVKLDDALHNTAKFYKSVLHE
jgi:nucleoside-diphosphate-sugar epimerase